MVSTNQIGPSRHPLADYVYRLEAGDALLVDTPQNLIEVVGILKSYGVVLDAYSNNLTYIANHQFLVLFPFFKYFNGKVSIQQLLRHWWHDRLNYEYAEYCMKTMLWHGGGGLDAYLDTPQFKRDAVAAIQAKVKNNWPILGINRAFPDFLLEQVRQQCYYSGLGQFWRVMSDIFLDLSDRYDRGDIQSIPDVVEHILNGLVDAASQPITYHVDIGDRLYPIIPESAGLTFLNDTAVPYVEAIFFRGTPFPGTISYNAQAYQIPLYQGDFQYGALFADPLPTGGSGIPPTLLMQDMRHFIPDYLHDVYRQTTRGEDDLLVQICISFQKSMFCVTTAALQGLAPHPLTTTEPDQQRENRAFLETWMNRFQSSRIQGAQD
ncbi:MAG TPA: CO2 hydration protein [Elainellaceae cyanobacterium]|jgi:CO2 hydration protein